MAINVGRGTIDIDVSQALTTVNQLGKNMKKENFDKCLEWTIKDTGNRAVKKFIKQEIPQEYAVSGSWVGSKVQSAKYSGGGGSVQCVVPVKGERGTIGGIFSAGGGGYAKGRAKKNGKALKAQTDYTVSSAGGPEGTEEKEEHHHGADSPGRDERAAWKPAEPGRQSAVQDADGACDDEDAAHGEADCAGCRPGGSSDGGQAF